MPVKLLPPARAIGLLATFTIVLIMLSVALLLWQMRKRDLERARLETASVAYMFREQAERTFESADAVLRGVQERMQTAYGDSLTLESPVVRLLLAARLSAAPHLASVVLTDKTGRVVNGSHGDADTWQALAQTPEAMARVAEAGDNLVLGRPERGLQPGEWTLDLMRSFTDKAGRFRGVVIVTMTVPGFADIYSWAQLEHRRPLGLYLDDGTLVSSVPARPGDTGMRDDWVAAVAAEPLGSAARLVMRKGPDGVPREFALAGVGRFPLLVSVASDEDHVLAAWRGVSLISVQKVTVPIASNGAALVL